MRANIHGNIHEDMRVDIRANIRPNIHVNIQLTGSQPAPIALGASDARRLDAARCDLELDAAIVDGAQ